LCALKKSGWKPPLFLKGGRSELSTASLRPDWR
jgi:hypothetical protein